MNRPGPRPRHASIARLLMVIGLGLLLAGAALAALVEPWFLGAALIAGGVADLVAALIFARRADGSR